MCVELTIFRPGAEPRRIETQGELAAFLRCDVPIQSAYPTEEGCLCPIDLPALAANLGATLAAPNWDDPIEDADTWRLWLP